MNQTPAELLGSYENRRSEREHIVDSLQMLIFTMLLILVILTIWLFKHKKINYIHETGLALFYGAIFGAVVRFGISNGKHDRMNTEMSVTPRNMFLKNISNLPDFIYLDLAGQANHTFVYSYRHPKQNDGNRLHYFEDKVSFSSEIFFNILLPPIIFQAGFSMKRKNFFKNFGAISMYAFIGTTVSCYTIGTSLNYLIKNYLDIPYFSKTDCYFFGAIISATDPVTTLTIFNDANVDLDMYSLVFGESVLNDVVSMILAQQIEKYAQHPGKDLNFFSALGNFVASFSFSLFIGCFMGLFNALITKFTYIRNHSSLETALFSLLSYTTYLAAETIGASGIVAVLFCGICQAHYTFRNLSTESQVQTKQIFHLISFLSENFIFIYIGVTLFTFRAQHWQSLFIIGSFGAIFVGRALHIYPLSFLINTTRSEHRKITFNMQNMLFFSGLRGAMAFSLAIRNTSTDARQLILTTTSTIVLITVLFNGGLTKSMLKWLNIKSVQDEVIERKRDENKNKKYIFKYAWYDFDKNFMKPFLTNYRPTLIETMPTWLMPVSSLLTTYEQLYTGNPKHNSEFSDDFQMEDVISINE